MKNTTRTVRSRPGMTQEEALNSLQSHPQFKAGTKIASIRRRGKVWVADLLEPKVAGPFPPSDDSDDGGDSAPEGGGDSEDSGPPEDDGGGGPPDGPEGL